MSATPWRPRPLNRDRAPTRSAWLLAFALAVSGALAGCAGGRDDRQPPPPTGRLVQGLPEDNLRLGEVPPQELAPGECGLFLWSRVAPVRLVFFADSNAESALLTLEERSVTLPRTAATGRSYAGQFERQTFLATNREVRVDAEIEWGELMSNGVRAPSGVLRVSHDSGWEVVAPVAGLAACVPR